MAQVTRETIRLIRHCADKGERYPLTVWELQQLAYGFEKYLEALEAGAFAWMEAGKIDASSGQLL